MTAKIIQMRDYKRKEEKKPEEFNLATALGIDRLTLDTDTDGTAWPPKDMLAPCDTE